MKTQAVEPRINARYVNIISPFCALHSHVLKSSPFRKPFFPLMSKNHVPTIQDPKFILVYNIILVENALFRQFPQITSERRHMPKAREMPKQSQLIEKRGKSFYAGDITTKADTT